MAAFSAFAAVSLFKAVRGDPSCGCFGSLAVNPWVTWAVDMGVVLALWRWRPGDGGQSLLRSAKATLGVLAALGLATAFASGILALGYLGQRRGEVVDCDLGDVAPNMNIQRTIQIPNRTGHRLSIRSITRDCNCVVLEVTPLAVEPGGSFDLRLQYLTPALAGPFQQVIGVNYYETAVPTLVLLSGTVGAWVQVDPAEIDFSDVCAGSTASREVLVRTLEPWPSSRRAVELSLEHGELMMDEAGDGAHQFKCRVRFSPPAGAPKREVRGELVLRWRGRDDRVIRVPCTGRVVFPLQAEPEAAFFGLVPRTEARGLKITVQRNACGRGVDLGACTVKHDLGAAFRVETSMPSNSTRMISLEVHGQRTGARGFLQGRIELIDPHGRVLLCIPVSAFVQ